VLLQRLNRASGGVATVVAMRRALANLVRDRPELRAVDGDFSHLLASWFNPGFLYLRQVDWNSPAALLEKIIRHEAVHAIRDWSDLRRRLQPDRRCFAFFHPQLPDEPLIFVEVALEGAIPRKIAHLIEERRAAPRVGKPASVAAFYSISNCEPGLRGVSLGNFLIKRVAERLRSEVPSLKRFCTLSPVPGFRKWLTKVRGVAVAEAIRTRHGDDLGRLDAAVRAGVLERDDEALLTACAATYLVRYGATTSGDPVARFHLENGAPWAYPPYRRRQTRAAELRRDGELSLTSPPSKLTTSVSSKRLSVAGRCRRPSAVVRAVNLAGIGDMLEENADLVPYAMSEAIDMSRMRPGWHTGSAKFRLPGNALLGPRAYRRAEPDLAFGSTLTMSRLKH
jgi:hypothetical protein